MATIRLFKDKGFIGRSMEFHEDVENLSNYGFNDQVSSCIITEGHWILYKDYNFQGDISILGPGNYAEPTAMGIPNDSLSSLRPLPVIDGPTIALFKDKMYRGRMAVLNGAESDFKRIDFNDQVSSIIVLNQTWNLYKDKNFSGTVWSLGTNGSKYGYYPEPTHFDNDAISSAQPA